MTRKKEPLVAMDEKMFKNISKTEGGLGILKEIVEFTIGEEIKELEFLNPELKVPNRYVRGKTVDLFVKTKSNKRVFVEVNNSNNDKTRVRNMAYLASKYSSDVKVGKGYETIDEFIQINLTNGSLSGNEKDIYEMRNASGSHTYVNNFKIYEYDVALIYKKRYNINTSDKLKYIAAMKCNSEELDIMGENDEKIKIFKEELDKINSDDYYSDWLTQEEEDEKNLYEAKKESKAEGKAEGKAERNKEIAKNMLVEDMDISLISKVTGLSIEEIEKLK